MAEKRKPELVFFARANGKNGKPTSIKIELFPAALWVPNQRKRGRRANLSFADYRGDVYRIRVGGKWYRAKTKSTFTLSEFFAIFRRSVKSMRDKKRLNDLAKK